MRLGSVAISKLGHGLLCMLILCISVVAYSQSADAVYTNANALYKANNYPGAQAAYEKLIADGYKEADLYYNLGNCYYRQNDMAKAILNYERALRISPNDEDISHNLNIANAHIADKIVPVPQLGVIKAWQGFTHSHSAKGWLLWAVAMAWLALIGGAVYLFTVWKKAGIAIATTLVLIALAFTSLAYARGSAEANSGEAILTAESIYVKNAPDANSGNAFMLHAGIKFSLLDKVGSYYKVRLADGKTGWLSSNSFEQI